MKLKEIIRFACTLKCSIKATVVVILLYRTVYHVCEQMFSLYTKPVLKCVIALACSR